VSAYQALQDRSSAIDPAPSGAIIDAQAGGQETLRLVTMLEDVITECGDGSTKAPM
jgi:hypothetical protein